MLAQALAQYADTYLSEQLSDEAWEEKPVPYYIAIDASGTFLNVIPHNKSTVRGKKTVSIPAPLLVPRSPVPRNAGLYPLLAADDIKYVLGVGPWTPTGQEENNQERHNAFAVLIESAAKATGDEGLHAAAAFYARPEQVAAATVGSRRCQGWFDHRLALLNEPIVNRSAVRAFWSKLYLCRCHGARRQRWHRRKCLISGKIGPISPTPRKD